MLIIACMLLLLWGSWEQVVAGWSSYNTVLGYPLALGAAATLVLAIGMLVVVVRDMIRGTPTESSETSVERESAMVVTLIFLAVLIGGMVIGMPIAHSLILTGVA